jgi:hypothetical protein
VDAGAYAQVQDGSAGHDRSASPVVVAGDAAQVRSEEHESIDALRIGGREDCARSRRLREPEDRGALDAHRVHDGPDVVHP